MEIKVDSNKLIAKLDKMSDLTELKNAMNTATLLVERTARMKAPANETGNLRKFMSSDVKATDTEITGEVFNDLFYAPYVEKGTGKYAVNGDGRKTPWVYQDDNGNWHWTEGQRPQPYLYPALIENKDKIKDILRGGLK